MKKKILLLFLILFMPFSSLADEPIIGIADNLNLRTEPTTESVKVATQSGSTALVNGEVTILGEADSSTSGDGCPSKKWYKIKGKDVDDGLEYEGYGCSSFVTIKKEEEIPPSNDNKVIEGSVIAYGTIKNGYVYSEANTTSASVLSIGLISLYTVPSIP